MSIPFPSGVSQPMAFPPMPVQAQIPPMPVPAQIPPMPVPAQIPPMPVQVQIPPMPVLTQQIPPMPVLTQTPPMPVLTQTPPMPVLTQTPPMPVLTQQIPPMPVLTQIPPMPVLTQVQQAGLLYQMPVTEAAPKRGPGRPKKAQVVQNAKIFGVQNGPRAQEDATNIRFEMVCNAPTTLKNLFTMIKKLRLQTLVLVVERNRLVVGGMPGGDDHVVQMVTTIAGECCESFFSNLDGVQLKAEVRVFERAMITGVDKSTTNVILTIRNALYPIGSLTMNVVNRCDATGQNVNTAIPISYVDHGMPLLVMNAFPTSMEKIEKAPMSFTTPNSTLRDITRIACSPKMGILKFFGFHEHDKLQIVYTNIDDSHGEINYDNGPSIGLKFRKEIITTPQIECQVCFADLSRVVSAIPTGTKVVVACEVNGQRHIVHFGVEYGNGIFSCMHITKDSNL